MVYQHFVLVNSMTVTQNIFLGVARGLLRTAAMREAVQDLCTRYGLDLIPTPASRTSPWANASASKS